MEIRLLKTLGRLFQRPRPSTPVRPDPPLPAGAADAESKTMPQRYENVPSPFCGIASDDLLIEVEGPIVRILEQGDAVTRRGFETPIDSTSPRVDGQPVSLEAAVQRAADLLRAASCPVFSGFGTDVADTRAAMALVERARGIFDQATAPAGLRNLEVVTDSGWMVTTLAEVRNRVDLLVAFGTDIEASFPRFFERFVWPKETLFGGEVAAREVIFLGRAPSGSAATSPDGRAPEVYPVAPSDFPLVAAALAALAKGETLDAPVIGGVALETLRALVERLKAARYGVVAWSARQIDCPHASLTLERLNQAIISLNQATRCVGLPLGGQDGDRTATQVCTWLSGYPVRVNYARGYPEYDPYHWGTERLLERGEADVLVWVSSIGLTPPPATSIPTIVLARPGMVLSQEPTVTIPVGVPGIDQRGLMYRSDGVVALPLKKLRETGLPSAASVLAAIEAQLEDQ